MREAKVASIDILGPAFAALHHPVRSKVPEVGVEPAQPCGSSERVLREIRYGLSWAIDCDEGLFPES